MALTKLSVALLAAAGSALAELQPIEMKGSKFFYKNGTEFFMKGVAYQQDTSAGGATSSKTTKYVDPLADKDRCKRDVPLLKELGTNTIRTYAIDPKADHSDCMKMLDDAGIYVISDLGEPALSINRDDPQWNTALFSRYQGVVDELGQYSNVIGFFAGNEVSNNKSNTPASAYVKAAVRDTKAYLKNKKNSRWMGVGYATNDDVEIREEMADYFNCGTEEDSIDFWGYNIYSWCGESSMEKSGYREQIKFFQDYSVPVFLAEYGCNIPDGAAGRIFQETEALYSDEMTKVFSGGIVYMYFQEANDYGLVEVKNEKVTKLKNFDALKKQHAKASPKGVSRDSYKPTGELEKCPGSTDTWRASSVLPPTPDQELCKCMVESASCTQKSDLDVKKYGALFSYICSAAPEICTGINGNASTGVYGAYSMCSESDKLTYVLDAYYKKQNKAPDACDFKAQASTKKPSAASSCDSKLSKAEDVNKEVATATSAAGSGGAKSTSTDSSLAVPGAPHARAFSIGDYTMGLYLLVAGLTGAGLVAL